MWQANIDVQKVDITSLEILKIVITMFETKDNKKKSYFFKKIFLFAYFSINVILEILFLILSNIEINFLKLEIFGKLTPSQIP